MVLTSVMRAKLIDPIKMYSIALLSMNNFCISKAVHRASPRYMQLVHTRKPAEQHNIRLSEHFQMIHHQSHIADASRKFSMLLVSVVHVHEF